MESNKNSLIEQLEEDICMLEQKIQDTQMDLDEKKQELEYYNNLKWEV